MKKIEKIILVLSIFTSEMGNFGGHLPINISQLLVCLLFLFLFFRKINERQIKLYKGIPIFLLYVLSITVLFNFNSSSMRMFFGVAIYCITFYFYCDEIKNTDGLLKLMFYLSYVFAFVGVIQELAFILKIQRLFYYDYIFINNPVSSIGNLMRVTSLTTEPAHLGVFLLPGFFLSLLHLLKVKQFKYIKYFNSSILLIGGILTFSIIVYVQLIICLIAVITFSKTQSYRIMIIVALVLPLLLSYNNYFENQFQFMQYKVDGMFSGDMYSSNNASSFAIWSNLSVAIASQEDHYYFGGGMDSHKKTYFEYLWKIYNPGYIEVYLNAEDAASLYIRILSEFGIVGLFLCLIFLMKNKIKKIENHELIILNNLSLIYLLTYSIRIGAYMNVYLWIFIHLYWISYKRYKKLNK